MTKYLGINRKDPTVAFSGNGDILIGKLDANKNIVGGLIAAGQVGSFSLTTEEEYDEMQDTRTGKRGIAKKVATATTTTFSGTFKSYHEDLRAILSKATKEVVAGSDANTITTNAYLGRSIPVRMLKAITSITLTSDSTDVTENFVASNNSVYLDEDQTQFTTQINDGDEVEITYSTHAHTRILPFNAEDDQFVIFFDGLNMAEGNKPVLVEIPVAQFDAPDSFELISPEGFGEYSVSGTALSDGEAAYIESYV
ncbi:hypothetical protein ACEV92_13960 [Vibrio parahaemolyticus]|nr:hypothetical protein [Vibrio parahaemolyticus]